MSPTSATSPDTIGTFGTSLTNTINGAGLTNSTSSFTDAGIAFETHITGFNSGTQYVDAPQGANPGQTSGTFEFVISYPFASVTDVLITDAYFWNYTQGGLTDRGWNAYTIDVDFDNNGTFDSIGFHSGSFTPGSLPIANHLPQAVGFPAINLSAGGAVNIRFNVTSNQGGNSIGFDEIVFRVIPEPSRAMLLLSGMLVCFARRRRSAI